MDSKNVRYTHYFFSGLLKHKDGWPFDRPITKADAPDYHLCVRYPMDLGTIRFVHPMRSNNV